MESGWDEFSQALEAKIQERIRPLEQQLSEQQEIISNLSESLQSILSLLQQKNSVSDEGKRDIHENEAEANDEALKLNGVNHEESENNHVKEDSS